jgi:hypothetical protein
MIQDSESYSIAQLKKSKAFYTVMVAHFCNPSYSGGLQFKVSLDKN